MFREVLRERELTQSRGGFLVSQRSWGGTRLASRNTSTLRCGAAARNHGLVKGEGGLDGVDGLLDVGHVAA